MDRPQARRAAGELDVARLLRVQVQEVHHALDEGLTAWLRSLPAAPPAGARVISLYVHAATVEDTTIQSLVRQVPPIYASDWLGKGPTQFSVEDLMSLRAYAQQVFLATDLYLASLDPTAASEEVDLSDFGLGARSLAWVISRFVVLQLAQICGELISAARRP